jgi:hypothetical protein
LTIAVPARLKNVLDTPEGLSLLAELLDHERARGRQVMLALLKQLDEGSS